jgi:hypothetical protein
MGKTGVGVYPRIPRISANYSGGRTSNAEFPTPNFERPTGNRKVGDGRGRMQGHNDHLWYCLSVFATAGRRGSWVNMR